MKYRYIIASAIIIALLPLSTGCRTTPEQRAAKLERKRQAELKRLRNLQEGEIYVVGRIELIPKLEYDETKLKTGRSAQMRDKLTTYFSSEFINITNTNSFGIYRHADVVQTGEFFVIKSRPKDKIYYSGATIWLESVAGGFISNRRGSTVNLKFMFLPGDRVYNVKSGAKAVYIGTWKYYRDEYNGIKKMKYINEYKSAKKAFRKIITDPKIRLYKSTPKKKQGVW